MGAVVLRGTAGGEHSLTFRERVLYHQIHPAKLFTDIATALVAIDLFSRHQLVPGLIIALLPPLLVSAVLVQEGNLGRYRSSQMASWHHVPAGIYGGLALVAICWANGLFRDARPTA